MIKSLQKPGTVFAITPDGPQGPAKRPKAGAIRAAQKTGAIIIPAAGQSTKLNLSMVSINCAIYILAPTLPFPIPQPAPSPL